ncbi:hypothetical protein [Gellertiella hungarica]|uniref:Mu-like prophage FluMu N-terminal domain-containing protein n=1 Tax=Gellertiella hungarica TaxID=1572859 RepID=A0A7W6J7J9_9HYPH|nr:hypothetical protein [Gellertiella hungarica]MBB4066270.1 hypothetical protein [Gellertiella hungarica]
MAKSKPADNQSTDAATPEAGASAKVLVVSAPGGPRRRAGFSFGPVPVELSVEDLGDDPEAVIEALRADPFLKLDARFGERAKEDAQE